VTKYRDQFYLLSVIILVWCLMIVSGCGTSEQTFESKQFYDIQYTVTKVEEGTVHVRENQTTTSTISVDFIKENVREGDRIKAKYDIVFNQLIEVSVLD
jgi:hypothetical protein